MVRVLQVETYEIMSNSSGSKAFWLMGIFFVVILRLSLLGNFSTWGRYVYNHFIVVEVEGFRRVGDGSVTFVGFSLIYHIITSDSPQL